MSHADRAGILPPQRLWTPWRMAYVGGVPEPGCVFCNAVANEDDAASLIVHRGEHAFVILNLFPYNTGHLMIVPNEHVHDPAALLPAARSEIAELTASFCSGLRLVMGCDGLNLGMNLGSAAGAGIADHLHQHIVPRWIGDANFMPIVGGTKVLPELLPATYAKIRAEIARQKSGSGEAITILLGPDRSSLVLRNESLPRVTLEAGVPVLKSVLAELAPIASSISLLGWGGSESTSRDSVDPPVLVVSLVPGSDRTLPYRSYPFDEANSLLGESDRSIVANAIARFP